ncbi:MAG: tRNA lysidine(34) synthetase TilS [Planctomycetota bacterium]|nr:MAG: tRNA lysidine(34) synthetase TilS [Planctomycetota bacterium]
MRFSELGLSWADFKSDLIDWLTRHDLMRSDARWVVGVSGGADSTLLLHALRVINQDRDLKWSLHVAHLHHGLRTVDADADEQFVRQLAEDLKLPLHVERADLAAEASSAAGVNEETARIRRYEFFERVALQIGSDIIAVAHHADDDAETVLHRICRGTGLRGLAGMRETRPIRPGSTTRLVRPLLRVRRCEIERLCAEQRIAYRTDATNLTSRYTRGRLRNLVLPMLREQVNPNVTEALLRLAEQARWLGTYLEDAAERTFESLVVQESPACVVLNTRALLSKPRIIQAEIIRSAKSRVLGVERDLSFSHTDSVLKLAAEGETGKELHLPGSLVVRKVYDRLEFRPLSDGDATPELFPVFINCPGSTDLPVLGMRLTAEIHEVDGEAARNVPNGQRRNEEWLDVQRLKLPLYVRARRDGDRFWPLGAPGTKSLGDFLSDAKIDPALRSRMGVVCDQAGPVWVMPLRIDERVKLRPTTRRALRLVLTTAGEREA